MLTRERSLLPPRRFQDLALRPVQLARSFANPCPQAGQKASVPVRCPPQLVATDLGRFFDHRNLPVPMHRATDAVASLLTRHAILRPSRRASAMAVRSHRCRSQ